MRMFLLHPFFSGEQPVLGLVFKEQIHCFFLVKNAGEGILVGKGFCYRKCCNFKFCQHTNTSNSKTR